LKQLTVFGNDY
jgi:UDP-glucose 4-epimerase